MKVTVNKEQAERKVVAVVNRIGQLILPNLDDDRYTIINTRGTAVQGAVKFSTIVEDYTEEFKIYEGDSITIQF